MERLSTETGLATAGVGVTRTGATPQAGPGGSLRGYGLLLGPFTEKIHRSTRADPPPTSFSTSAWVAMEVSPGVVMARAPCAAP